MVDKMKKKLFNENIVKEIEKLNSRNAARSCHKLLNNMREHFKRRFFHTYPPMKMEQSVPKRWHIKFRRRGIAQKNAYNIQNTAKV